MAGDAVGLSSASASPDVNMAPESVADYENDDSLSSSDGEDLNDADDLEELSNEAETSAPPRAEDSPRTDIPAVVPATMSKHLKGKEKEWKAISHKSGPLTLLELPDDVLRLIVKEVCSKSQYPCCRGATDDENDPDHSYQRPHVPRTHKLDPLSPCSSAHIRTLRYCLARCTHNHL
jgi:hypothetical protein